MNLYEPGSLTPARHPSRSVPLAFSLATLAVLGLTAHPAHAQANLFVNGDFSQGNTGFQTTYSFITPTTPPPNQTTPGQYGVGTNPVNYSMTWASFGDHTTGTGNMLVADGSTTPGQYVWQETISGLTLGTQYTFSGFVASNNPGERSPAMIELAVGGVQLGNTTTAPTQAGVFVPFSANYTATATTATFQIYDTNTVYAANDFALDDLSLRAPVPEASTTVSFGLLLALGLGGLVVAARKKRSA